MMDNLASVIVLSQANWEMIFKHSQELEQDFSEGVKVAPSEDVTTNEEE